MSAYVPPNAPLAVLAFLGTVLLLLLCGLAILFGLLLKSRRILRIASGTGAVVLTSYVAILFGFSVFSREVRLPMGSWKYFCEIDCHIANSVSRVRTAAKVVPQAAKVSSHGQFVIVEVKTWFDPSTIGAQRGNGPLTPNERSVLLVDGGGRNYQESPRAAEILSAMGVASTPPGTPLRPGEDYISYFVFEVPADAAKLRLLFRAADPQDALLWGHENSPLHKKITFCLDPIPRITALLPL